MARGYGHRKFYPYVTKKQLAIAPGMKAFVDNNKAELTSQGNKVLNAPGKMQRSQATPPLDKPWSKTESKAKTARKISKYVDQHGGSRGKAKKVIAAAHAVSFGADPKTK